MYAVVQTGGKQYRVEEGNIVLIEKLPTEAGKEVVLDKVLLIGNDDKVTIGRPVVEGASVLAEVVRQTRGPRIIVFKKRSKKGYKKTQGHRQYLTEVRIKKIKAA
ncbi:MAG TPA: 50S ribosomal protein L21 [Elusimicrobia bacterium]|nr:MAG: 50S ribosomal protein L21 [Elusimicrobia bacterium RIFOXYA12_FULL_49_49]OGS06547.1 MAG: 50S ribosomal protein L21 [Elusimicrobia bacterium RIFOXYA1_FULL_47_7]OGS09296.1 MAG: 50S ribosomal protein L21 [Elusimicrobia bacterium RIFOXYB1_FULL_48_9]OGS14620.1 MAG: 50S ribosomal protein L21 [Elusimicrobia bacterium RIFOXYA2_FULL_47_53]OGS25727.1 MAG: 50S ribosomal protein L21 [Elusimicrobia bacterium RIFOXYB12_FULL_50_12]OGS31711.1 MAG: 50S ribosomal protein L21 [Elusimicrobia bacterium RIFO